MADHIRSELGVPVCISGEVSPQIREYPRMITTACNAATMPVIGPYLDELQKWLSAEGFGGSVLMMLSNGGVVSADDAARFPIRLVESGPAAGALAGSWFARRMGEERLLCFDMGGTTAKACLIEHGEPELTNTFEVARIYRFKKGSGFPVSVPSVDLVEIGAGGGSLARVDQFGLLKVGPESGGADPGPASYGRGGTEPAVTDADVLLGLLDPAGFLGGDMPLDASLAEAAAGAVADALGLDVIDTASGIHEVVNQNMAAAARMHAVEMGVDLRGTPVIAFGGAGPVHACGVAELLESPRVVFPVNASVLSAFGTLVSPVRIDLARSMVRDLDDDRRGRARRRARRPARRGSPGAARRRRAPRTRCASATAPTCATPARATRSRSGSGEGDRSDRGRPRPTSCARRSSASTAASTASRSPTSASQVGHVAAVGRVGRGRVRARRPWPPAPAPRRPASARSCSPAAQPLSRCPCTSGRRSAPATRSPARRSSRSARRPS